MMRFVVRTLLLLALVPLTLAGCQRTPRLEVPIQGMNHRPDLGVDIEVINWAGSVTVVSDPKYTRAQVLQRVRRLTREGPKSEELRQQVVVNAEASIEGGRRLLRVRSTPNAGANPELAAVDVIVRVARAEDVRISNTRGPVSVSGFAGTLNVENGSSGAPGGDIQVRTQRGIKLPVTLTTNEGNVIFKSGPGSKGTFDLLGGGQMPEFVSKLGTVTQARPDPARNRYRAVLDGGTNGVTLRTDKGLVVAEVIENAGTAGPDIWDGWPDFTKGPRIFRPFAAMAGQREADKKPAAQQTGPKTEIEPLRQWY